MCKKFMSRSARIFDSTVVVVVVAWVEAGVLGVPDARLDLPPPPQALATRASATAARVSVLGIDRRLSVQAEECVDVGEAVAVVAADGAVERQGPGSAPASDGLGGDPEEASHFRGGEHELELRSILGLS